MTWSLVSAVVRRLRLVFPFLVLPIAIAGIAGFRGTFGALSSGTPYNLPPGWSEPSAPADNPITMEKFVLGRYLFYDVSLSGDNKTSCATCHSSRASFSSGVGPRAGAFGHSSKPTRTAPRLVNLAYDSVYTWDGHIHTLEQQVPLAIMKRGDFEADTNAVKSKIASKAGYATLFTQAFGSAEVTIDRIAKAIATFERCLISANSPYDRYVNGDHSAMTPQAVHGMQLFFDTTTTNCSGCHSDRSLTNPVQSCNTFTDNNYYATGTFDSTGGGRGGYGFDTTTSDGGRFLVSRDSQDVGKFRTPTLRNVALGSPYGSNGTIASLAHLVHVYNIGGFKNASIFRNQDTRIRPLGLTSQEESDIVAFLQSLTDTAFVTDPEFQDPGPVAAVIDPLTVDYLNAYPNPSTRYVTIGSSELSRFGDRVDARVLDSRGVVVAYEKPKIEASAVKLDLERLSNGSYTVLLGSGSTVKACKIVLQK